MLIDTHCHLDDSSLRPRLEKVIAAARDAGVDRFIVPGVAPEGWDGIAALAVDRPTIFPAFGIHPMASDRADDRALARLATLARGAVAIGEIGLDYLVPSPSRAVQQVAFREQLRIAVSAGIPALIHCRKAFQDILRILREEGVGRIGGIMHAFSGSVETARECIGLGLLISVSGTVTYHNAVRPVAVAREIPMGSLVLETDAPDMTPEPLRGTPNEPAFMIETARRLAELKGVPLEEVARETTKNAHHLLRLRSGHERG
ncbi:MAG: TatD family deoxyribonuclease [Desulfuromonadales bacterium]|nr:MAG: TatD family deoxyribonuclease [Desulfuromonadales bacterium]